jgi:hypothetical protein
MFLLDGGERLGSLFLRILRPGRHAIDQSFELPVHGRNLP